MSVTDNVFTGSIPALYDQYLGSLLFQPYASDIAGRLTDLTGGRLLETAPSPWPGLGAFIPGGAGISLRFHIRVEA